MVQQIFTLVLRLNPSLGFVAAQEIQNATNNNNKKQRRNLDSGALRPRVTSLKLTASILLSLCLKDAQMLLDESRSLQNRVHLVSQAQQAARSMEQDYEEVGASG